MTEDALAGGGVGVGIYEAAGGGVVIAGLEVIEAGFGVVDIAAVAEGVDLCQVAGSGQNLAVGIVGVGSHYLLAAVQNVEHIALVVGHIVVGCAIVGKGIGVTAFIVEEVQGVIAPGFPQELAAPTFNHPSLRGHLCPWQSVLPRRGDLVRQ